MWVALGNLELWALVKYRAQKSKNNSPRNSA